MSTTPFNIYYEFSNMLHSLQIRPCCKEDSIVDYAVWDEGQLLFTMTRQEDKGKWIIALKNADDLFDDDMLQLIGKQIEKKMSNKMK